MLGNTSQLFRSLHVKLNMTNLKILMFATGFAKHLCIRQITRDRTINTDFDCCMMMVQLKK